MNRAKVLLDQIAENIELAIVGKRKEIDYLLVALLCGGHVLIEDVPGVGKTTLVRALAKSLGCDFKRIQFTPDLLPSDATGVSIFNQATAEFEFRPGPIFTQILLADEINRTSPKTQSALLEAMEEGQVTVDGVSRQLPNPFLVLATQNPIEYEGTFPLPEAQLDRFLLKLQLGYPNFEEERQVLRRALHPPIDELQPVASSAEILELQGLAKQVHVDPEVEAYILKLIAASRNHQALYLGGSPRAAIALYQGAQALALLRGRDFVTPDDVKELAPLILSHRLILKPEVQLRGGGTQEVISELLGQVAVPVGVQRRASLA